MLEYYRTAEAEMPADSLQWHRASVSAPDASKVTAWRTELSLSDQLIFEAVAGDALATFGYPLLETQGSGAPGGQKGVLRAVSAVLSVSPAAH